MSVDLGSIKDLKEALALTVTGAQIPPKVIADRLGIECRHLMRMINADDSRHFPPELILPLMIETKNWLPLEWLASACGFALHDKTLGDVLAAIRNALTSDGKDPNFYIHGSGRVEDLRRCGDG